MINQLKRIRSYALLLAFLWTAAVSGSFVWLYHHESEEIVQVALAEARATFEKDTLYRRWGTYHGGVYVKVTETTQPNPYLAGVPERDVTTPAGTKLTLINPAYMVRQVFELADKRENMSRGHLTSLKPLRPENRPDPWEAEVLARFERGEKEAVEVREMHGRRYLRFMRPFITEQGCLKCHGKQGYKVGDVRGGISVSVPIESQRNVIAELLAGGVAIHGVLWLLGVVMIGSGARVLSRSTAVLEASEERYRTVADYTDDWEYWQAPDGSFRYVSPSCVKVCAFSHDDFYRDPALIDGIIHPDDLEHYHSHVHDMQEGNPLPIDFRIVLPDGEVRWISHVCRAVYTKDGRENGVRASNRDITDRKRAEAALKEQAELLAKEVRERQEREAELEAKNAELERFTYTVSHDLKSPLITIKGFAGAVLKDVEAQQFGRLDQDVRRIMGAADKMTALLNDLLELSRIGRLMNPPTQIDMNLLVRDVLGQLSGPITQHGVEVVVQPNLPDVWADAPRMAEVLQNLVENAVKYMGGQERPRIDIGVRAEKMPVFYVRDNGAGIRPQYHETIFGLFNKLDARTDGTGIGLALARRIVEYHGGKIWVESEGAGEGSTFCFTLAAGTGGDTAS